MDGPDVWIKINYVSGWHDWCLDSICFASFPKTWTHISLQFVMPWPTLDSFALGLHSQKRYPVWGFGCCHQLLISCHILMHTGAMPTSHPVLVPHPCAAAEATNPPPDQTPCNDLRPQHWVEQSKNGDSWVLSKDGAWDMIKSSSVASLCQQTV